MQLRTNHILNPVFVFSLGILILNDHFLKNQYHNWITGKLSDVFGIVVFVQFLSVFIPEQFRKQLYLTTACIFVLWKSELSTSFISLWNSCFETFQIGRVVDYTDLICLAGLLPLYHYKPHPFPIATTKRLVAYPLMLVTTMAIMATSRERAPIHFHEDGLYSLYVGKRVKLDLDETTFLQQLTQDGIQYRRDSFFIEWEDTFQRLRLNNLMLEDDTIQAASIGMRNLKHKTELFIETISFKKAPARSTKEFKAFKKLRKRYRAEAPGMFKRLEE